jgi:hypothetical protein
LYYLIYVDESGNLGFKFGKGSSTHFVLVMLVVNGEANDDLSLRLAKLRAAHKLRPDYEFKFRRVSSKRVLRQPFFAAIASLPFTIRVAIIDKRQLEQPLCHLSRPAFYAFFLNGLAHRAQGALPKARLILDGDQRSKQFARKVRWELALLARRAGSPRWFGRMLEQSSAKSDGLQLADMLVGAIAEWHLERQADLYHTFNNKIADIWYYPETSSI